MLLDDRNFVSSDLLRQTCEYLMAFHEAVELINRTKLDLLSLVDVPAAFRRLTGLQNQFLLINDFTHAVASVPGCSSYFYRYSKRPSKKERFQLMLSSDEPILFEEDFVALVGADANYHLPRDHGTLTEDRNLEICLGYLKIVIPIISALEEQRKAVTSLPGFVSPQVWRTLQIKQYAQPCHGYTEFCDALFRELL
jgi:hypothetical protein